MDEDLGQGQSPMAAQGQAYVYVPVCLSVSQSVLGWLESLSEEILAALTCLFWAGIQGPLPFSLF